MTSSSTIRGERGGRTILVVDDEPGILQYIRRILEQGNHTVLTSQSGEHAWSVVQKSQAKLDLVWTDIIMPGSIDGPALAARIEQRYKKLPVLFMTGALPENDEQAVEMTRKRRLLAKAVFPAGAGRVYRFSFYGKQSRDVRSSLSEIKNKRVPENRMYSELRLRLGRPSGNPEDSDLTPCSLSP